MKNRRTFQEAIENLLQDLDTLHDTHGDTDNCYAISGNLPKQTIQAVKDLLDDATPYFPKRVHDGGDGCIIANPRAFDVTCDACMKGDK